MAPIARTDRRRHVGHDHRYQPHGRDRSLVRVDAKPNVTVVSASQITATTPAGSAGTVDVTVTTPGGTSATGAADHYTYVNAPTVTQVAPPAGPLAGGTNITITGTNLTGATTVSFGSTAATNFTINGATGITATAPAESAGTVNITVTTPGGTSATSNADQYTYLAPAPTVTQLSPLRGRRPAERRDDHGHQPDRRHRGQFGSTPRRTSRSTPPRASPRVAPGCGGTVDVTVTTPGGTSPTSAADRFTYNAPPPPRRPGSPPPRRRSCPAGRRRLRRAAAPLSQARSTRRAWPRTAFFQYGLDPATGPRRLDHALRPVHAGAEGRRRLHHPYRVGLPGRAGPGGALPRPARRDQQRRYHVRHRPDVHHPEAAAPPAPVLGTTENAQPVTGTVFIRSPSGAFVRLTGARRSRRAP